MVTNADVREIMRPLHEEIAGLGEGIDRLVAEIERLRKLLKAVAVEHHATMTHWRRSGRVRFEECTMGTCVKIRAALEEAGELEP